tara:strand:+ start:181 stop:324 length:144 start_codon:yes stop_codon:yes gene_type:complete
LDNCPNVAVQPAQPWDEKKCIVMKPEYSGFQTSIPYVGDVVLLSANE